LSHARSRRYGFSLLRQPILSILRWRRSATCCRLLILLPRTRDTCVTSRRTGQNRARLLNVHSPASTVYPSVQCVLLTTAPFEAAIARRSALGQASNRLARPAFHVKASRRKRYAFRPCYAALVMALSGQATGGRREPPGVGLSPSIAHISPRRMSSKAATDLRYMHAGACSSFFTLDGIVLMLRSGFRWPTKTRRLDAGSAN